MTDYTTQGSKRKAVKGSKSSKRLDPIRVIFPNMTQVQLRARAIDTMVGGMMSGVMDAEYGLQRIDHSMDMIEQYLCWVRAKLAGVKIKAAVKKRARK